MKIVAAALLCAAVALGVTVGGAASQERAAVLGPEAVEPLISLLRLFAHQYEHPLHDLQSAELRKQRSVALCQKLQELGGGDEPAYSFRDWPGAIRSITKVWFFSRYELTIDVEAPLAIHGTVEQSSELLMKLINVPLGSKLKIGGEFKANQEDCLDDERWTKGGMMIAPQFAVTFKSIEIERSVTLRPEPKPEPEPERTSLPTAEPERTSLPTVEPDRTSTVEPRPTETEINQADYGRCLTDFKPCKGKFIKFEGVVKKNGGTYLRIAMDTREIDVLNFGSSRNRVGEFRL
jgi:hypothetical protein